MKEIKVFHPAYGWGDVVENTGDRYPIQVEFQTSVERTFTSDGKEFINCPQSLSFSDYTGTEPIDVVTLDKLKERMKPKLVEGKRYKVWNDQMYEGCYFIVVCVNAREEEFSVDVGRIGFKYDHWEELPNEKYD